MEQKTTFQTIGKKSIVTLKFSVLNSGISYLFCINLRKLKIFF